MRNAFINTLTALSHKDKNIILLTGDLGFSVFENFQKKYPRQFLNMGVAEANMMSAARGLSAMGFKPVVYSIATFATMRGFEQIRTDIALGNSNVKIVGSGAGLSYGHAGSTHHALEDIAIMRALPNMTILCPCDPYETTSLVKALMSIKGPVYLRLGKKGEEDVYPSPPKVSIGKGIILKEGTKAMIIATGNMVYNAVAASCLLRKKGLSCGVVDMHTVKPADEKLITEICKGVPYIFTLEEHSIIGGLGGAVAETIAGLKSPKALLRRLGIKDLFIDKIGSQQYLRDIYGLTPEKIGHYILQTIKKYD